MRIMSYEYMRDIDILGVICHLNKRTESTGAFCSLFFGAAMSHVPTERRMANLATWVYIVVFMKPPTRLQVCGCFQKYRYPKMDDGLEWNPLLKLMIWGYPCFWKHPCSASCFFICKDSQASWAVTASQPSLQPEVWSLTTWDLTTHCTCVLVTTV